MAVFPVVVIESNHVRVSVIIPTHNEAQAIGRVLTDLPSDLVTEVLVAPAPAKISSYVPGGAALSASSILFESPQSDCVLIPPLKIGDAITKE